MNPAADPTIYLTGMLVLSLVLAALLAFPTSLVLLGFYRRAVEKRMRSGVGLQASPTVSLPMREPRLSGAEFPLRTLGENVPPPTGSDAKVLHERLLRTPWRAAAVYASAGFGYALFLTILQLLASAAEFSPLWVANQFWFFCWLVVVTLLLVAGSTRRVRFLLVSGYLLVLVLLGVAGLARRPAVELDPIGTVPWWVQIFLLWIWVILLPSLLLWLLLSRRVRAVGPLVFVFLAVAAGGFFAPLIYFASDPDRTLFLAKLGGDLGLSPDAIVLSLGLLSLLPFALVGGRALRWLGNRYARKQISDQSITVDAIWLLFTMVYAINLALDGPIWVLLGMGAFLVYKSLASAGFARLRKDLPPAGTAPKLLLLRVFSLGRRSERLFDAFTKHWRHVGSIRLIAGPDLAKTTIEPDEFLTFLAGKLSSQFIDGPQVLAERLRERTTELEPDPDGRFRVHEFFCRDEAWRMTFAQLVEDSDAVLMDLRGKSAQNTGIRYELEAVLDRVPLERVVFLVDDTTDKPVLQQSFADAWNRIRPASPNHSATPDRLRILHFSGSRDAELHQLLRAVASAARPTSPIAVGVG